MNYKAIKFIKPVLVFGSKGKFEYFAILKEERIIGSTINVFKRHKNQSTRIKAVNDLNWNEIPYDTWLECDCPENIKNAKGVKNEIQKR